MDTSPSTQIIQELRKRDIRAMRTVLLPGWNGLALSMSTVELQLFIDILVPPPMSEDDELARRIGGRSQDLGPDDEAWRLELTAYPPAPDSGLVLRGTVNIPEDDVAEVLARLADKG